MWSKNCLRQSYKGLNMMRVEMVWWWVYGGMRGGYKGQSSRFCSDINTDQLSCNALLSQSNNGKTVSSWDCAIEEIQVESRHFQMCSGLPVAKKLPQSGKNIGEDKGKV